MKCTLSKIAVSVLLLTVVPLAQATPLQRSDVAADPVWVAHLDLDRLRSTSVGEFVFGEIEKSEIKDKLAAFQAMFRFDLRTQLHGLTVYGMSHTPEEGVLLVYADFDADHLATLAKGGKDYESAEHNRHTIHSWIDESHHHRASKGRTYGAMRASRVIILSQTEGAVAKALDVLDNSAPNLAASKAFPTPELSSAFFQAAAQNLKLGDKDPHAAVFRLSKTIRFEVGEEQKRLRANMQLIAGDEEVAKQIASIGQGLISLIKLQQQDHPEAGKFADALTLKQDANEVTVTMSIASSDAVDLLKAHAGKKQKKAEGSE
jgi:hypothetical protein